MIGIRELATYVGEGTLDAAGLAELMDLPIEGVLGSLGGRTVRVSKDSGVALARRAAEVCLHRAGTAPADLDAFVLFDVNDARHGVHADQQFQHELGATKAFSMTVGSDCSDFATALSTAHDLVRGRRAERVLVASGTSWSNAKGFERRALGTIAANNHRDIFSDGAGAALVEACPQGVGIEILGFGFASDAKHWDHLAKLLEDRAGQHGSEERPRDIELAYDALALHNLARDRCLRDAGLEQAEVDFLVFPQEANGLPTWFAKHLGFPASRLIQYGETSHIGAPDPIFGLEELVRSGARRGATVLVACRSIGNMRFVALRL